MEKSYCILFSSGNGIFNPLQYSQIFGSENSCQSWVGNIDPDQWNICGKSYYNSILLLKIINIWYVGYSIFNIFYSIFFQAEILQSKNLSKVTPTKIRLDKHFVFWYVNLARLLVQGRFTNHANKFFGHYWTTTSLDSNSIMFCVPQGPFSRLVD